MGILDSISNYRSLSVKDLLEAREHYHLHLLNKKNVVGTAVGLYLIRDGDPWPDAKQPKETRAKLVKGERTLENSQVRPYSWPCVLVFVERWVEETQLGGGVTANDIVPKTLYLPDGRTIPVCVVKVSPTVPATVQSAVSNWPDTRMGGGFPILSLIQGQELSGSVGCLVNDGHTTYALTSRHVVGNPGEAVYSRLRGNVREIGLASAHTLSRAPFNEVFPYLPRSRSFSAVDVGLVTVDDVGEWTSRTFGLDKIGPLADINEMNLGTQLIDQPVCAYGARAGKLSGTIKALFYRFNSVAGVDYVGDVLIAPDPGSAQTGPGDSGTIWHLVLPELMDTKQPVLHPLAIEWGGQGLAFADETRNFALATFLSNVLHRFNVQIVSNHNTGVRPFWGATGHYSIARYAIDQVKSTKLAKLLLANASRISFERSQLEDGDINSQLSPLNFVPLADVPDIVWKKSTSTVIGGRNIGSQKPEHPTHYADIDEPGIDGAPSLLEMFKQDAMSVNVQAWRDFYDSLGHTRQSQRGLLPFRIWQFFDAMKAAVGQKDYASYVAAAGILAHYVGDACQPLHGSVLADGYADQAEEVATSTGKTKKVWPAQGIHSAFENKMIDDFTTELFDEIERQEDATVAFAAIQTGQDAAVAVMTLMAEAQKLIAPAKLCDKYIELGGGKSKPVIQGLWAVFGKATAKTMFNGAVLLATIWEAAWLAGQGEQAASAKMVAIPESDLQALYQDPEFLKSLDIDNIGTVLR